MEPVKYGIVGCGWHMLHSHALTTKDAPELKLSALCDVSKASLEKFTETYGSSVPTFTDETEFLKSDIDAVLIGSPDQFHFGSLVRAIVAKKHVFVEKPIITKTEQIPLLEEVLTKAQKDGLVVSSCHPRRVDPPYEWINARLPQYMEGFGKVICVQFDFSYHKPTQAWKKERSLLLDHLNHEIDLVNFLLGSANFEAWKLKDGFDEYQVSGIRDDGVTFMFRGVRKLDAGKYVECVTINFERGSVHLAGDTGKVIVHDHEANDVYKLNIPPINHELRGKRATLNFVDAIRKRAPCYLTAHDLYVNNTAAVMLVEQDRWKYVRKEGQK